MSSLLSSVEFWFGAFLLFAYQIARFSELSALDPAVSARSALIPNLRASDFTGRFAFFVTLSAFLAATLGIYLILCLVSPTVLHGWAQVSGAAAGEDLEKFVGSVPYPLYIAAAFMGLTQPAIPILSKLGDMQRNLFHALIGVPRRVVDTSTYLANQIFARSSTSDELGKELLRLVSDPWLERIDAYADAVFYRHQLARLKLEDDQEVGELLKGSKRELKNLIAELVYAASLATVRESGSKSLDRLAADLDVALPPSPATLRDFLAGGILFLIGMTFLWSVIPMFDGLSAKFLSAGSKWDFWPDTLSASGQYLMSQAGPIFVATGLALATWSAAYRRHDYVVPATRRPPASRIAAHLDRYAGLFVGVVVIIVAYDLGQAFFDYGYFREGTGKGSFWAFVLSNLPFFLLHSFISLAACFVLLLHVDEIEAERAKETRFPALALLTVGVGLASLFYAVARLYYQFRFKEIDGVDFVVLVVVLNVSAALLAYATAVFYCRRQVAVPQPDAPADANTGPAAPRTETRAPNPPLGPAMPVPG
jgi:hypothetical protein